MKIFAMIGAATAAATILGATAIADTPNAGPDDYLNDVRLGEQVDRICFRDQINDFREGTSMTVIAERGVKDYLIETTEECDELNGAQTVVLDGTFAGGRCVTTRDRISASQSYFGSDASNAAYLCRIKAIYEWNEDALSADVASID
ncbi:hypothetical protein D1224_11830 [Henriciella barbarensis]|uniref:Uncharacterized protein n=1 Tax=Henriciella barbarensis TaxID=86342 RepID=A0A399QTS1_9PROT|nr:DUF6491 family protein [Henriciella barbarensis]RIJ22238.1 hypothetical protein D1224_11830 [Henriciella barbarensis]